MSMFEFVTTGEFKATDRFLDSIIRGDYMRVVTSAAGRGVAALRAATPKESGETASAWAYKVQKSGSEISITWTNGHIVNGVPIAVILQYGHGTGTGGYVAGRDYINPALRPIFEEIAEDVWKAVKSA